MSFGSECKDNVLFDVGLGGWRLKPLRAEGVRCTGLNYTDKAKGAKLGYTETHGEPAHEGLTAHVRVQRRRRTCGRCAPVTRNPWTLAAQMPARRGPAGSWRALDRPGSLRLARASLIWTNPPRPATPNPPPPQASRPGRNPPRRQLSQLAPHGRARLLPRDSSLRETERGATAIGQETSDDPDDANSKHASQTCQGIAA